MKLQIDIHPTQTDILNTLLFTPTARFSELKPAGLTSDHFSFHINRLTSIGLVEKHTQGYRLTALGKEFANRLDTEERVIERQAKTAVLVAPFRTIDGVQQVLYQERLKQPYYGFWGFITGKIKWGETVTEAAARELAEEANLQAGTLTLTGIYHKMDYSTDGNFLEDKYFYNVRAEAVTGELLERFEGGRNHWYSDEEIMQLRQNKLFDNAHITRELNRRNDIWFVEQKHTYKPEEY